MLRSTTKRLLPSALAAVILSVLFSGVAVAFYRSSGSTDGSYTPGSATVSIAQLSGATPNSLLQPGSSGEAVLDVTNPNGYPMTLTDVVSTGDVTVIGGSGCTAQNSGVTFTNQDGMSVALPANTTTLVRLPGSVAMSSTSYTGCEGTSFNIPITITAHTS